MTTGLVVSVTDELVAELEALALERIQYQKETQEKLNASGRREKVAALCEILPKELLALLAERAELKRDAERLQWMIEQQCLMQWQNGAGLPVVYSLAWPMLSKCQGEWYSSERAAIDAAMQSEAKP